MWWEIKSEAPPPITALKPSKEAGDCWPMDGDHGHLTIELAAPCHISGFTMEHIGKNTHLAGTLMEAPKKFSVHVRVFLHNTRHQIVTY